MNVTEHKKALEEAQRKHEYAVNRLRSIEAATWGVDGIVRDAAYICLSSNGAAELGDSAKYATIVAQAAGHHTALRMMAESAADSAQRLLEQLRSIVPDSDPVPDAAPVEAEPLPLQVAAPGDDPELLF